MKGVCIIFLFLCSVAWGQDSKRFVINGSIPGIKDGLEVGLYDNNYEKVVDATAVTKDGKFMLEGKLEHPVLCMLFVDMSPEVKDMYQTERRGSWIFLDNSVMSYSCESVDSFPRIYRDSRNVKVTGSPINDLYQQYMVSLIPLQKKYGELDRKYLEEYHRPAMEGVFNVREGIAIVRKMDVLRKQMQQLRWDFLKNHGNSVVGIQAALDILLSAGSSYTKEEINNVLNTITPVLHDDVAYQVLKEQAENMYPVAKGEKYTDIELTNEEGTSVRLADYVKSGQYNMLEFWASWCGPCMREMPNVVKLYNECKGKNFEIVGVSLDQKRDAWLNAVEKNKMKWIQVSDLKSWATLPVKLCNVSAVPYTVLIDPQGKVIALNLRGEELINKVKEVLNKK